MKKKTKKLIAPLILVIVLALLIVGYVLMKGYNDKKAEEEATEPAEEKVTVLDKTALTMTSMKIGDDNLNFSYVNDVWLWDEDDKFPLDGEQMSELCTALSLVEAKVSVDEPGELSEYGLDKPALVVKAAFSDGSENVYSFGNVNQFNGFQYFSVSGVDGVYMLDQAVAEPFKTDIKSLFKNEACPIIDDSVQANTTTSILIETPEKSNEITDEAGIKELFTPFYAMNLSTWEDYYADSEEMALLYGIDENSTKVTLTYTKMESVTDSEGKTSTVKVPHTYTVLIGSFFETDEVDEEGNPANGYFYTVEGSTVVYSVMEEKVKSVLEFLDYVPTEEEE